MIEFTFDQTDAAELDRRLMHSLAVGLRTAEIYEPSNTATRGAVEDVMAALAAREQDGEGTRLDARNHCIYVDKERVRAAAADFFNHGRLLEYLESWGIGTIIFGPGTTTQELSNLFFTMARTRERSLKSLLATLRETGTINLELEAPAETPGGGEQATPLQTYASSLRVCREIRDAIQGHQQLKTRRLRRVTQGVVNSMLTDEYALLALSTLKEFDDYLFNHSVNVAVLAVALGQRMAMPRPQLGELCLAAFLHDLGKITLPKDIVNKPGRLDETEWDIMRTHPEQMVHILLAQQTLSPTTLRSIVTGFEHHINYDMSGYPRTRHKKRVSVFGRILTVADRYDAVTTPRTYRAKNMTPHEGIRHLLDKSGTEFDPVVARLFVQTLGLYPPGSVLGLDSDDIGVVQHPPTSGQPLDRPTLWILSGPSAGAVVDLAEQDGEGAYTRTAESYFSPPEGIVPAVGPEMLAELGMDDLVLGEPTPLGGSTEILYEPIPLSRTQAARQESSADACHRISSGPI